MKSLAVFLLFFLMNCSDSNDEKDQNEDFETLDILRKELVSMASASVCSEEFTCEFVGVGSKACGGFQSYMVYSTSINTVEFLEKVAIYTALEKEFNEEHNIISDCSLVLPPSGTTCENGKCKAVYN